MRSERWWQDASVVDQLFKKAGTFEFIQSARLLRHVPHAPVSRNWSDDFKFETSFSLSFPATEIEELRYQDERIYLTNLVVGLTGTQGTLPYTYTNKLKQSSRQQRLEAKEFLGLFNHTLTAKYVDASLTYNLPIRYEIEQDNHYLDILHALNGYISSQHEQQDLEEYFAEFAGLMQGQNNTAHALKTVLTCMFNEQVRIQEFVKEKFQLGDEQKTSLGGKNPSLLGVNTFCGDTVQQIDGKIEIQIGPLKREQYLAFLPEQPLNKKLKHLIQTWCSPTLFIDVRLILDKSEIGPMGLNSTHNIGLGQGAFLMPSTQLQHNIETRYALLGAA